MNELLGLYGFEKFDWMEIEYLNVDRFISFKVDDSLLLLDDVLCDDVSVGSCDSLFGRSDLFWYNWSKFWDWWICLYLDVWFLFGWIF